MSAVDYFIKEDGSSVQIKAWGQSGTIFRIGDEVRPLWGKSSYYILVREGSAIRVENCKIHSVVDHNNRDSSLDTFDHFGQPYNRNTTGLLGEPYFWADYYAQWQEDNQLTEETKQLYMKKQIKKEDIIPLFQSPKENDDD